MKKVFLTRFAPALLMAGALEAAIVQNVDQNWSSNPPVEDVYFYNGGSIANTWTVTGNIVVGDGATGDSRLFVGLWYGPTDNGILNLVGGNGSGDTLLLNGSDGNLLGRLGHVGVVRGTLNILGGLAVTWGGRNLLLDGPAASPNVINIVNGSLDYTTPGFGFADQGGSLLHIVSTNGAIVIAGQIYSEAGFDQWGDSKGMDAGDVRVQADAGLFLKFTVNSISTTITATTEPQMPPGILQNINMIFTSNPPVADTYFYNGGTVSNTWTVTGNIVVGDGATGGSRLFVGLGGDGYGYNHGILNLVGANGSGDSLLLNGTDGAMLGRLGHDNIGSWRGTLNIRSGLAVTWGGRQLWVDGDFVTNAVNVMAGSLNYTTPGFSFDDQGGRIMHTIGTNGSIIVGALIDSATGFDQWGVSKGMSAGDITVQADTGLKLVFTQNPPNTTITAKEPVKGTFIRFY